MAAVVEVFFGKRGRTERGKELEREAEGETGIVGKGLSSENGPPAKRTKQEAKEDETAKHDSKSRERYRVVSTPKVDCK